MCDIEQVCSDLHPGQIHLGIRTYEIAENRLHMETHFFSERYDRIVAICKQQVVTYDYAQLKKVAVPDFFGLRILALESGGAL